MKEGVAQLPLRSCLYECSVMHHRLRPKEHRFAYRIFLFGIDLDEIDRVSAEVGGFSRNRFNWCSFRDSDHIPLGGEEDTGAKLRRYLQEEGVVLPADARVLLVTMPRVLGYIFNPVSFYFCATASGEPLCAVAEVGNTFGEMKLFLLREVTESGWFRLRAPKHFYVSPFSELDVSFDFRLRMPGEQLEIHIHDVDAKGVLLVSALSGERVELTTRNLLSLSLRYPLVTLRVIFLIHWNALRLWFKGVPYFAKADRPHLQKGVLRPHRTVTTSKP